MLVLAVLMPSAHAEQMSVQIHGQAEGLDNLTVQALTQDTRGFLWAATENGLYRFDGARFERIGWDEGVVQVNALAADTVGAVWIGSRQGLFRWHDGVLRHITRNGGKALTVVMPQALALADPHRLWVISEEHLFDVRSDNGGQDWQVRDGLDAEQPAAHRELQHLRSVIAAADGGLWLGCGEALCRLAGGRVDVWGREQGLPADDWATLLRTGDGSLWLRGDRHLMRLPSGAARWVDHSATLQPLGAANMNLPLAEDRQGRVLYAGFTGLQRQAGRGWERFDADNGLPPGGRLSALFVDREGGVWIARAGAGLFHWSGYGQWENWSTGDGLPHTTVWALARDGQGRLHAATSNGLAAFDTASRRFSRVHGTAGATFATLAADRQGRLWSTSRQGEVVQLRSGADTTAKVVAGGLPFGSRLIGGRDDSLWAATDLGLYRWRGDGTPPRPERIDPSRQAAGWLDVCQAPDGALWLAGDSGLSRHTSDAWRSLPDPTPGTALGRDVVACAQDGSVFSAGARAGLRHGVWRDGRWTDTDITPAPLRTRQILALLEDRRGWLWVATDNGVAVWNRRHWRFLDQRNGLVWNDTSQNAFYEDADGSIWIGTSRGASHLVAPESLFAPNTATAFIQSVQRDAEPLPTGHFFSLPWSGQAVLEFGLAMPSFRDRTALAFEYRLTGYDTRWSTGQHPNVRFTGLAPGRYRFEVRLADTERETRSDSTAIEFEIKPPWWGTPLFRAACALLMLASPYGLYRWRMRVFRQREQRLETLVRERTHELEASHEQLRELATRDSLTGAWNRRAVLEILERELVRGRRERHAVTLVLADIDHFKRINDAHGHPAGDAVLREFVARLNAAARNYDAVGRYGGEEFLLVLPGISTRKAEGRARLDALHAVIGRAPMPVDESTALPVTCSFGVVSAEPDTDASPDALIRAADEALYRAKRGGRDRIDYAPAER